MKTILIDIDGTILKHHNKGLSGQLDEDSILLPGVIEAFNSWASNGYNIILMTGRYESSRAITEKQLKSHGLFYNQLIMGIGRGERIIINDSKLDDAVTCKAYTVKRNKGIDDSIRNL